MYNSFTPNYNNLLDASYNKKSQYLSLYEHNISENIMQKIMNKQFSELINGDYKDKKEYFNNLCKFWYSMGYDAISYEACIVEFVQGGQALSGIKDGIIKTQEDFDKYDFNEIENNFFNKYTEQFTIFRECLPKSMKIIGGLGNGVFEIIQDFVSYERLCMMRVDDPILYKNLFEKIGDIMFNIWKRFLTEFQDIIGLPRFGDDLGYKTSTMLMPDDIRNLVIPQYKRVVALIRSFNKPFILHSCGSIFEVMDDIISNVDITAKHSNEDQIAPIERWINDYNDRIAIFGGVDMGMLCQLEEKELKEYVKDILRKTENVKNGFAIGSGNSIPDYVPVENYITMVETIREYRNF